MRSSRQNDKFEHWVMQTAVKDEVLGSMLGSNKQKVFSTIICLCYTVLALQSVSLLICSQLKAGTHLTRHKPIKQWKTESLGEQTCSI